MPAWIGKVLACGTVSLALLGGSGASAQEPVVTLDSLFELGTILQDRNEDGVADFVDARFVLSEAPTAGEVAAAAEIAARLGFETMALDLPIPRGDDGSGFPFVIGAESLRRAGFSAEALGLQALAPGEGLVTVIEIDGQPGVAIAGRDETGTHAAGEYVAGRLPAVWDPNGTRMSDVADEVRQIMTSAGLAPATVQAMGVKVASRAGLSRLDVWARMTTPLAVDRAVTVLEALPGAGGAAVLAPLSIAGVERIRVAVGAPGSPPRVVEIAGGGAPPAAGPMPERPGRGATPRLGLSRLYQLDGFLADTDDNLIPDRIDVMLSPSGDGVEGAIDLAARIGLEATGLSIPLVRTPEEIVEPDREPSLILIGTAHPLLRQLEARGRVTVPPLQPGEGYVRVVHEAFGDKDALVVTGADAPGVTRALAQVSERFPHVWDRGKDRATVADLERELQRTLAGRSPAGQSATALYKLERLADELSGTEIESATVTAYLEQPAAGLSEWLRRIAEQRLAAQRVDVAIERLDLRGARAVESAAGPIGGRVELDSEVDAFWTTLREEVIPVIAAGQAVDVAARLSESPILRARIEQQAHRELLEAGADPASTSVTVLSAYKQGYSWLYDVVRPALIERQAAGVVIRFAEAGPPEGWRHQAMYTPTRWLLELHPIDEVLARELGIDLERVRFEKQPVAAPTYEVIAVDAQGDEVYRGTFEPTFVVRPYFDQFPDYERVRVTTGWIAATVGGERVVDRRIVTDVERFWDYFQATTLPAIYDYVMTLHDGKPRAEDAPHFGELTVEVSLSEPDYQVGIDREQIASMEALHEEIYFATLHFFDVVGRFTRGEPLRYPGRIVPLVTARSDGRAGFANVTFTGFNRSRPGVVVEYRRSDGSQGVAELDVPKVDLDRPVSFDAVVRHGQRGLARLGVRVKVDTERDERADLVRRARAEQVDARIISAEQVQSVLRHLEALREGGLHRDALAFDDLGEIAVSVGWAHEPDPDTEPRVVLARGARPAPAPDIRVHLRRAGSAPRAADPLVQWETPIPPSEAYAVLAQMAEYPEATVYKVGDSYLGAEVWAMDLMSPVSATHWSHAKATTFKPTVVYSARQHANEVSSTSHVLRLAELLLTEPTLREALKRVNVVIHPIANPDGAQLAFDLYERTPDHMLHAGYLGALGVDVTSGQWEADPLYPESTVRPEIWRTWLPDIFLNPHGYPSHEWVQLFSEYAGWVRNRVTESRDWWGMRGWFVPSFDYIDDPRYPRHKAAAFRIRELIAEHINAVPEVRALNQRAYARYRRYGHAHDAESFKLDFTNDVLIYTAIEGLKGDPTSSSFMARNPRVTIWSGSTEAPDETAHGDWLRLVATAGLQWDQAILAYVLEGDHRLERAVTTFHEGTRRTMHRPRPPAPAAEP